MKKIFLLEDNPFLLKIFTDILVNNGYEILSNRGNSDAIKSITDFKPDLLVVDSLIPGYDGYDYIKYIKEAVNRAQIPSVILITGYNMESETANAKNSDISGFLMKYSFNCTEFLRTIKSALGEKDDLPNFDDTKELIDLFEEYSLITKEQFQEIKTRAKKNHSDPLQELINLNIYSKDAEPYLKELVYKADYVKIFDHNISGDCLFMLDGANARRLRTFPVYIQGDVLHVAMENPLEISIIDQLRTLTGKIIEPLYASGDDIDRAIQKCYGRNQKVCVKTKDSPRPDSTSAQLDSLLMKAIEMKVSDIHFEPRTDNVMIRYRIDGVLHDGEILSFELNKKLITRLKVLASMDIANKTIPQDGSFQIEMRDISFDLRVSTIPSIYGEKAVIRILDRTSYNYTLDNLGIDQIILKDYRRVLKYPNGMILITGPTGSGKTTTLYASLENLKSPGVNIISVEDPVEYRIQGVNQIQVNKDSGLTFATFLRHALRQDPNIIIVGEIRDMETAEIASESALTGHLVLGTLHTRDSVGAIIRLVDINIPPFLISATLNAVIAQRLIRRVCSSCKVSRSLRFDELKLFEKFYEKPDKLYYGTGCEHCNNTGYKGRTGIFEFLEINAAMRSAIVEKLKEDKLYETALKSGLKTMRRSALEKAAMGETTIEEVLRMTMAE